MRCNASGLSSLRTVTGKGHGLPALEMPRYTEGLGCVIGPFDPSPRAVGELNLPMVCSLLQNVWRCSFLDAFARMCFSA